MKERILMTGLNGTVAPWVKAELSAKGYEVLAWQRNVVPPNQPEVCEGFLNQFEADTIFHIGMGPPDWAAQMAAWCKKHQKHFVFTSTASVYASTTSGPFSVDDQPDAEDEYGTYKRECEKIIGSVNPEALIVRLGWQIGRQPGSNNMVDYFYKQAKGKSLQLSKAWFPACSFLEDTATTLVAMFMAGRQGLFHLDGNPGLNQYEIGSRINKMLGNPWEITPVNSPVINSLMKDNRIAVRSILESLPAG